SATSITNPVILLRSAKLASHLRPVAFRLAVAAQPFKISSTSLDHLCLATDFASPLPLRSSFLCRSTIPSPFQLPSTSFFPDLPQILPLLCHFDSTPIAGLLFISCI
ncbi:hypothetical protein PIB30_079350, partial [Stylosanthes scabra]|nr:hypothetical protein [Stylosanthes scabra]